MKNPTPEGGALWDAYRQNRILWPPKGHRWENWVQKDLLKRVRGSRKITMWNPVGLPNDHMRGNLRCLLQKRGRQSRAPGSGFGGKNRKDIRLGGR